jgi:hypothetical protein
MIEQSKCIDESAPGSIAFVNSANATFSGTIVNGVTMPAHHRRATLSSVCDNR